MRPHLPRERDGGDGYHPDRRESGMLRSEGEALTRVVVCTPGEGYAGVNDPAAHGMLGVPDLDRSRRQHGVLCEVLRLHGAEVVLLPEPAGQPNAVFTRDTSLVTPMGHLHLRMGLETRR